MGGIYNVASRKSLSLQSVFETVVQEMRKLVQLHPMFVIATKATTFGDRNFASEAHRLVPKRPNKFGFSWFDIFFALYMKRF